MHVIHTPRAISFDASQCRQALTAAGELWLRELKSRVGVEAPCVVVDAAVADGVREEALRRNADLVVTGRGQVQGTVSRLWAHLYPIVRESPCPVISI